MLVHEAIDEDRVIEAYRHYIGEEEFSFSELATNLRRKLEDPGFRSDLDDLVIAPPGDYDTYAAADVVMERLGSRLTKAPPADEVRAGGWRS